jgi:hypothetical protein
LIEGTGNASRAYIYSIYNYSVAPDGDNISGLAMLLTEIAVGLGWDSITEHSGTGTQPERSFISVTALRSRYQNSGQGVGSARDNEVSSPGSDIKENPTGGTR